MSRPAEAKALRLVAAAPLFAALGDESRLRLLARLSSEGPLSIARLADGAAITRQAITKHLDALADAGLVKGARVGRERVWELEPKRLDVAKKHLDQISAAWDRALYRLKALVEEDA
jgi:DNA-binding transcriptional ArsR family regulator